MLIWAVGGGKGGTGKSLVANGLALRLAERGQRVVLVDADFGGANQHTYCGLRHPSANLGRFFEAKASLEEVMVDTAVPGLRLVPGNLNSANTDGLNSAQKLKFFRHLRRLDADHVFLDLGAGTQYDTLDSFLLADVKVAVITPEPLSIENLYLFVKNLQYRMLGSILAEVHLREVARDLWKNRAQHGIATVMDLGAHLGGLSPEFAERFEGERSALFLHLVLNEVREFRQVDQALGARSAVVKYFQVPTDFAGFIHHDKDLWHQFGQGANPVLKGASFAMTHDLEALLDGIQKAQGPEDAMNPPREPMGGARCREVLEVGPEATHEEIHRAYLFLKGLYTPGPGALPVPSMDEFAPEAQARILAEVEAAYHELCAIHEASMPALPAVRPAPPEPDRILDGPGLRRLREAQGFTLERMAEETNVRLPYLEALEEERYRDLPSAAVIVRGYLTACFAALGASADASVADYVRRYQRWQGKG